MKNQKSAPNELWDRLNNHPIIRKRGKLFRNWWNHRSIYGVASALTCPECGSSAENLVWKCHDLTIPEASELAHKRYEEAVYDEEDDKTLANFKEEERTCGSASKVIEQ